MKATRSAGTLTAEKLFADLRGRQSELVDAYMCQLVPDYELHRDRLEDMREAGEQTIALLVSALAEQRPISRKELDYARAFLRRALLRGATEVELVRAAQLWQRVVWDALVDIGGDEGAALAARLSRPLIEYVDALSGTVAESVESIQAARNLTGRASRAELLEDLLAARPLDAGALGTARTCGLEETSPLLVVSARPIEPYPDPAAGAVVSVALAHAVGDAVEPLFGMRGDETVIIRATPDEPKRIAEALEKALRVLEKDGIALAVGVSAIQAGLRQAPPAYAEACLARERLPAEGGLLVLAVLGPLDYLLVRGGDDTAWSLVSAQVREFIEEDLGQAGLLVQTLEAYVNNSLNVKVAAETLFVHANTAHYRLAKIEQLTGRDVRNLGHLEELMIAVRLARRRSGHQ